MIEIGDKKEKCKECPELDTCDNNPINCLRSWYALFSGSFGEQDEKS